MRGCLQLKAALTRLNTNLVSQRGALAALRDSAYRDGAEAAIRANLAHLEQTLAGIDGLDLAVTPRRGLACALELADEGPTAQELMVALFARRVAVYPGDGLGEERAATTVRLNLSAPSRGDGAPARRARRGARRGRLRALARAGGGAARRQGHRARRRGWPIACGRADDVDAAHGRARLAAVAGRPRPRARPPARVPRRLDAAWPDVEVAYSYKTNRLPAILRALAAEGAGHEVVCEAEYALARDAIGARGTRHRRQRPGQVRPRCWSARRGRRPGRRRRRRRARRARPAPACERVGLRVALPGVGVEPTRFGIPPADGARRRRAARALGLAVEVLERPPGLDRVPRRGRSPARALASAVTVAWPPAGPERHVAAARALAELAARPAWMRSTSAAAIPPRPAWPRTPRRWRTRSATPTSAAACCSSPGGRSSATPSTSRLSVVAVKRLEDGTTCAIVDAGTNLVPGALWSWPRIEAAAGAGDRRRRW